MDDVDDVRAALGYDQINLYGGSYGATAVQVYILRHGDHVRSAAVNGVSLLEVPMFEQYPENSQAALDFLFARCEKDGTCSAAYPDLGQEFAAVLARLEQGPVTVPFDDPATGEPAVLTSELFKTNIHTLLVDTQLAPMAPKFIHLLYTEDWEALEAFLAPFLNAPRETSAWTLMSLNIMCHEDWAKMRPAETAASDPGSYLGYEQVRALTVPEEICAALPEPPAAALYGPLEKSDVPILLINGEADPQDPPANVADARERYPNSLGLVAPGQGHAYTGLPCQSAIVTDFIASGSTSGLKTDCLAKVGLPAFAR
jgi:pimeloyl-ACP methyl ester carboxylesterase